MYSTNSLQHGIGWKWSETGNPKTTLDIDKSVDKKKTIEDTAGVIFGLQDLGAGDSLTQDASTC
jgi:hypothetical protein